MSTPPSMALPVDARRDRFERWSRLGLTSNPFRVLEADELGRVYLSDPELVATGQSPEQLIAGNLNLFGYAGPGERGKTTQLDWIESQLMLRNETVTRSRIRPVYGHWFTTPPLPCVPTTDWWLIDEIDWFTARALSRLWTLIAQFSGRCVITCHTPIAPAVARSPFAPHFIELPAPNAARVCVRFAARCEVCRLKGSGIEYRLEEAAAGWLLNQFSGLRQVEARLYDLFQNHDIIPELLTVEVLAR